MRNLREWWSDRLGRFTHQVVIGDRCPCDRCSSNVKYRAFGVMVLPVILFAVIASTTLPNPAGTVATLLALIFWHFALGPMFSVINDRMPEFCLNKGVRTDA